MEIPAATGASGKRRRPGRRSLEYPCVSRLRLRRLLAYLSVRRLDDAFDSVAVKTDVFFHVEHMQGLVRRGRWHDAVSYLERFASPYHEFGDEGEIFLNFVHMHKILNSIVAGKESGTSFARRYERYLKENPDAHQSHLKLGRILFSVLYSQRPRTSINWVRVRHKGADMIEDLIHNVPEFNDLLRMPCCPLRPHNVIPINGFSSRQRRHVKVDRLPASTLARFYLEKKKRLPSSNHCQETNFDTPRLSLEARSKLADILNKEVLGDEEADDPEYEEDPEDTFKDEEEDGAGFDGNK